MLQRSTADTLLLGWSQHREDLLKAHCPLVLVFWKWYQIPWTKAFHNQHDFSLIPPDIAHNVRCSSEHICRQVYG